MKSFIKSQKFWTPHQFRYQPRKLTSDAVLDVIEIILKNLSAKNDFTCTFIDLPKEFYTVDLSVILEKCY